MTPKELRERAEECELLAARIVDSFVKTTYQGLAVQWRDLADQAERHGLRGRMVDDFDQTGKR